MSAERLAGWPDEARVRGILNEWSGSKAFDIPVTDGAGNVLGNNGDALLQGVYRDVVAESGIVFVSDPAEADVLMMPPGGAMVDTYRTPRFLQDRLRGYPEVPLILFPSSALFRSVNPAQIFGSRKAPTTWMLREAHSYENLTALWGKALAKANVELILDHDMVAAGHGRVLPMFEAASSVPVEVEWGSTLVAARVDVEAHPLSEVPPKPSRLKGALLPLFKGLPIEVKRWIRARTMAGRQQAANDLLVRRLRAAGLDNGAGDSISRDSRDISDPTLVSFSDYARAIMSAEFVVTNRLHVALPAAALGKVTYLIDAGYHKLRGVYERSLENVENIHLVRIP